MTPIDYLTKWVEAIPTKHVTEKLVMDFLEDKIITHFGVPTKITIDNAKDFSSAEFSSFFFKYGIVLSHSSNYYPRGNGLAKYSNKKLITIIKKMVGDKKRAWDSKIKYSFWDDRITKKSSTRKILFELVSGLDVTPPVHLRLTSYQLLQNFKSGKDVVHHRIDQIVELDETRRRAFENCCKNQSKVKRNFVQSSRKIRFSDGDMVLIWDRKNENLSNHDMVDSLWLGPYIIKEAAGQNFYHLTTLDRETLELHRNGQLLKLFYKEDI